MYLMRMRYQIIPVKECLYHDPRMQVFQVYMSSSHHSNDYACIVRYISPTTSAGRERHQSRVS